MTKWASGWSRIRTVIVAAAVTVVAGFGRAEGPGPELVAIRREVLTTLAREATAKGFTERQRAVEELAALHGRLEADARSAASPALRALQRRVAGRLARVERSLAAKAVRGGAGGAQAEAQKLIDLIQATVRPETWDVNGGRGSIVYFATGHGLVVLAPEDVHEDLGGLIRQLR